MTGIEGNMILNVYADIKQKEKGPEHNSTEPLLGDGRGSRT